MIAFIVLHYKNYEDTKVCVDSIRYCCAEGAYHIVVVDNGSNNGSKEFFTANYPECDDITFIYNERNLGFSAGNNVGCRFAAEKFKPDFLYVVNNDTKLKDVNVLSNIAEIYREESFDIMGPAIYDSTLNCNLNPSHSQANAEEVERHLKKLKFCRKLLPLGSFAYRVGYVSYSKVHRNCRYTGFGLCGAALIFSRKYYERFKDVFSELTYIYAEESFLKYREQRYNLKMIYSDKTHIEHFGSKATKKMFTSAKKLIKFKVEANIAANEELIKLYKNDLDC